MQQGRPLGRPSLETMKELCLAVMDNAEAFTQAQVYTGLQQRLVKAVRASTTIQEVEAITWPEVSNE